MKLLIFRVSFQYSENTYCTNIVKALCERDVVAAYKKYQWYSIQPATEYDLIEAEKKGMPVVMIKTA